jgi:two-component system, NarL family, response regulator NreC
MSVAPGERIIRVMIVDGRALVREGWCALLRPQPDLHVVAQAATLAEAQGLDVSARVVVTALDISDATRATLVADLRRLAPGSCVLVLTPVSADATLQSVLAAGADGYVLETADAAELLEGVRSLGAGRTYVQRSLGPDLARMQPPGAASIDLTLDEKRLLGLLARGHTNAEVAQLCGVSLRTVEARRGRLRRTLGRQTRAELVEYAREAGLL